MMKLGAEATVMSAYPVPSSYCVCEGERTLWGGARFLEKKRKRRLIALASCAAILAVGFGLSWLAGRFCPGIRSKGVRVTAASLCLGGAVFNLIFCYLKEAVREKRWIRRLRIAVDLLSWAGWILYGVNLF